MSIRRDVTTAVLATPTTPRSEVTTVVLATPTAPRGDVTTAVLATPTTPRSHVTTVVLATPTTPRGDVTTVVLATPTTPRRMTLNNYYGVIAFKDIKIKRVVKAVIERSSSIDYFVSFQALSRHH